jgi:hypothetical protein
MQFHLHGDASLPSRLAMKMVADFSGSRDTVRGELFLSLASAIAMDAEHTLEQRERMNRKRLIIRAALQEDALEVYPYLWNSSFEAVYWKSAYSGPVSFLYLWTSISISSSLI